MQLFFPEKIILNKNAECLFSSKKSVYFLTCPEAEFISPLQQTIKQNHRALHNCNRVKNMLKHLAFKWLLNVLLLKIE